MIRNLDERVGYQIGVAAHLIQNTYNHKLSEYDLTVAQAKVLYMLVNYGEQLQSELQNRLFIKGSTMNGIIDSMLKKQLIEKNDSKTDRRSKIITLTEKGKILEEKLWLSTKAMEIELMKGFSNEEKQLLLAWLKRITENFKK
ncbi:MarR family transcriptional regulator [Anaerobacillus alkalidiazotrophicus]|uniref:MarR family transcriptional regulator n=1 Tax=Anaerobacillus alkalidiazotrophicus TaxID=472963 RepID=A0A1S2M3A6_9BACI|nr:MarR family transcriptional regulator [Anaerobacillus alkalidiazotrophicus]OIJ18105.1 MarR family transcriptional regulator [Anaerobacillus alkalidiazotrophicus]OIJ19584.1 MarR family transcriptional regulator [Anaerobacillus alkalidiazotrophicus]